VRLQLRRGSTGLASVTATAPFLGGIEMAIWIMSSFKGIVGERSEPYYFAPDGSLALYGIGAGLLVAIPARFIRGWVCSQIERFEMEMSCEILKLENYLLLCQEDRGKPNTCPTT
jgi:biopolymer transport protein ExbB